MKNIEILQAFLKAGIESNAGNIEVTHTITYGDGTVIEMTYKELLSHAQNQINT